MNTSYMVLRSSGAWSVQSAWAIFSELELSLCVVMNKWEEKRQKIIIQKYNRILKKNNATHTSNDDVKGRMASKKSETSGIKAAQLEYKRIVENKKQKREEKLKKKKEIQEALERYKQRKAEVYKKLSKKTKKGQPLMKESLAGLVLEAQDFSVERLSRARPGSSAEK
uniref:Thyroid transcription factor 1-associated protein 26 n=1 Tax=Rhodnius prolixus TaxID=13249 RepID=T1HJY2_RHOPR